MFGQTDPSDKGFELWSQSLEHHLNRSDRLKIQSKYSAATKIKSMAENPKAGQH